MIYAQRRHIGPINSMRWAITLLAVALLLSGCASRRPELVFADETGALNRARVEAAAAPLLARGAIVAVMLVGSGDSQGADFARRLSELGLLESDAIVPEGIALYVSMEPRYSELRAGSRWSRALPSDVLRAIREEALNPALRAGQPTDGAAAALAALDERLAGTSSVSAWLATGARWLFYGVVGVVLLYIAGRAFARPLRRLRDTVLSSPPGRLAVWLWELTPPGRRRALRLRKRRQARASADLANAAEDARSWCKRASSVGKGSGQIELLNRLHRLNARRRPLERQREADEGHMLALASLAEEYRALAGEARLLCPEPAVKREGAAPDHSLSYWAASSASSDDRSSSDSSYDWPSSSFDSGSSGGESSDGGTW